MERLSARQAEVLAFIKAHGGVAVPDGGGYWSAGGVRIEGPNVTQTVYSLKNKLLLKRTAKYPQAWRDHYVVAEM